ncbi:TatD family hydrolase [Desulforhopalus vacuolatus]|uniref:TatD family hydrolase n=1 Tax=Desulforhopalus vacuolatus TaxID=40414 RepID=UPI0019668557|nr:TatD family hydrolase [Desulforhopalus vacuolatus]MBM9520527.1 TatD family hydrolase [Desulforhopalus vacuolatus]
MKKKSKDTLVFPRGIDYFDSHCHLDMETCDEDRNELLARAQTAGITNIMTIGTNLKSSEAAVNIALQHDYIFAAVGIHPHDVDSISDSTYDSLINLYKENPSQVKGFGEIGLDYYKNYCSKEIQKREFARQLEIAEDLHLPVIIHDRDADNDCFDILSSFQLKDGCLMHCFGSDYPFARKVLDQGMMISISGVVTFKNAPELHEVATKIPLDRMMIETDGPYLTPVPYRGKRNESAHVRYTAARIAELRGISIEEVAEATSHNARQYFHIEES